MKGDVDELKSKTDVNSLDTGSIFMLANGYNGTIKNALPCTGGSYLPSAYPTLFDRIGYSYGGEMTGVSEITFIGLPTVMYLRTGAGSVLQDAYTGYTYALYNTSSDLRGTEYLVKFDENGVYISMMRLATSISSPYENVYIELAAHGCVIFCLNDSMYYTINDGATFTRLDMLIYGTHISYYGSTVGSTSEGVYIAVANDSYAYRLAFYNPEEKTLTNNISVDVAKAGCTIYSSNGPKALIVYKNYDSSNKLAKTWRWLNKSSVSAFPNIYDFNIVDNTYLFYYKGNYYTLNSGNNIYFTFYKISAAASSAAYQVQFKLYNTSSSVSMSFWQMVVLSPDLFLLCYAEANTLKGYVVDMKHSTVSVLSYTAVGLFTNFVSRFYKVFETETDFYCERYKIPKNLFKFRLSSTTNTQQDSCYYIKI